MLTVALTGDWTSSALTNTVASPAFALISEYETILEALCASASPPLMLSWRGRKGGHLILPRSKLLGCALSLSHPR